MAAPQMPYAQRSSRRRGVIFLLGAIAAALLTVYGQGVIALVLLATLGAALGILLTAGQLTWNSPGSPIQDKARRVFTAFPVPLAATTKKGKVIWASEAFSSAVESSGWDQDLSKLGGTNPDTAAAIFRLFAAARQGRTHAETIALSGWKGGDKASLKVVPVMDPAEAAPILIWQIEGSGGAQSPRTEQGNEGRVATLDSIPAPALLVSNDFAIEGANKSFLKLFGYSPDKPVDGLITDLVRGHRGSPISRARLRGMLTKSEGPIPIQVASADKNFWPAMLYVRPVSAEAENGSSLWIVSPAPTANGGVEEGFQTLLSQSPVAMALITSKGILQTANRAFQNSRDGEERGDPGSGTGIDWKAPFIPCFRKCVICSSRSLGDNL